jgi:CRP-like cAMP-binding protein
MITNDQLSTTDWEQIDWARPPLCWLNAAQQLDVKAQSQQHRFGLGEVIWSNDRSGREFLVIAGNVRLVPDPGKSIVLKPGDWFGDLPELTGQWKARAASKEVRVIEWDAQIWLTMLATNGTAESAEIRQFWTMLLRCPPTRYRLSLCRRHQQRCSLFDDAGPISRNSGSV